jgi:chorismate lyase / 3-hydroxybenzoate synthase
MVSAVLPHADALRADELRRATAGMYGLVRTALAEAAAPHPVRIWNFLPGIHTPIDGGLDRYRAFNLGRFDAFERWFGDPDSFASNLPTATGIGHHGHELAVHVLGATAPGHPVENSRQRPAFRYSRRYGPRPPCFSRATRASLRGADVLLIGGTASVRDEDSVHHGSLTAQLAESVQNLESLLRPVQDVADPLGSIVEARVYFVRPGDADAIRAALAASLPSVRHLELVNADICRAELLVEIEALASLTAVRKER